MKDISTVGIYTNPTETASSHYITIDGQCVPISDDIQKLINKEINDARNRARREHSCCCTNISECYGDCGLCKYHVQGIILSTDDERYCDGYAVGVNSAVRQATSPEDEVMARETIADVMKAAAGIVKNGDVILMKKAEGFSEREIAAYLGLPRTTLQRQICKLMKYLEEHRSEFINW